MLKQAEERILKNKWLAAILGATVLLKIPSLFEPYWYGDEAIYLTIGQALRKGLILYSQIHDNKPPLIYLVSALANGDLFWFKFIALGWSLLTIYMFYRLAKKIFDKRVIVLTATSLFAFLICWPKLEGNIANAELFFLLPTLTAGYILWNKELSNTKILIAGIILGLGGLFKVPALLEAGVWPLVWIIFDGRSAWKKSLIFAGGVLIPIVISLLYYFVQGAGKEYITAVWIQNLPYLASWKSTSAASGIYSLKGRLVILLLAVTPILGFGRRIGRRGVILSLWGLLTIFSALLSGRPYPHYLLQTAGASTLLAIMLFWGKRSEKVCSAAVLLVLAGTIFAYHFDSYPVIGYYSNFVKFSLKRETKKEYFYRFDGRINDDYTVAEAIVAGSKPNDKIFVWGDAPMIYALTKRTPAGKYTVRYHIKEYHAESITMKMLIEEPPKYIVSYGNEEDLPGLNNLLMDSYKLQLSAGSARVFRLSILD